MTEEEKVDQEKKHAFPEGPPFMKALQEILGKEDLDCAQVMSRLRATCCGDFKELGEQKKPPEQ